MDTVKLTPKHLHSLAWQFCTGALVLASRTAGKQRIYSAVLLEACILRSTEPISSLFFLPRRCVPSLRLHICITGRTVSY